MRLLRNYSRVYPRRAAFAPCISCVYIADIFSNAKPTISLSFLSSFGILFAFVPATFLHAGYSYGANKTLAYFRLIALPPPPLFLALAPSILSSFTAPSFILFRFTVLPYPSYYTRFGVLIPVLTHAILLHPAILLFCDFSRCSSMKYGVLSLIKLCMYIRNQKILSLEFKHFILIIMLILLLK